MIKGRCVTNLDEFKQAAWPYSFFEVPKIGSSVEGEMGTKRPRLKVVAITHCQGREGPYIEIELHR